MARPTFSFQWHLLDDCDQRCKHCYIFSGNETVELNRMSLGQMQQTLANIEDFCETFGREPYLYITVGDPILHPDFWTLMEILKDKGIEFTVMGNPFHLTDEVCARLRECGCLRYQMSIDGARETHDWFRKSGSYDETLARIPMLARGHPLDHHDDGFQRERPRAPPDHRRGGGGGGRRLRILALRADPGREHGGPLT